MALWTPGLAGITRAIELNPWKSSTVTLTDGYVSQVDDESGNGRHAVQTSASLRPNIASAEWDGQDVLSFDGGGDFLTGPYNINAGSQSVFVAFLYSGTNTNQRIFTQAPTGVNDWQWSGWRIPVCRSVGADQINSEHIGEHLAPLNVSRDLPVIFSSIYDAATGIVSNRLFDGTEATGSHTNVATALNRYLIGNATDDSGRLLGKIGCLLVVDGVVDTDLRNTIFGYMAWLFGLESSLPSDHPYKTAAPTIDPPEILINTAFSQPIPAVESVTVTESFVNGEILQVLPVVTSTALTESLLNTSFTAKVPALTASVSTENVVFGYYIPPPPQIFARFGADCSFVAPKPVISGAVLTENVVTCGYVTPRVNVFGSVAQANNITVSINPRLPSISGVSGETQGNDVIGWFFSPAPRISGLVATENLVVGSFAPELPKIDSLLSAPQFYRPIVHRRDGLCNTNWITGAITAPLATLSIGVE